jgi:energy-coupling factor transporter ATP-binding protein EcfA2
MIRIKELIVENIGPFEHQKFVFPEKTNPNKAEIQLLTGENGTGKSTLLMMLAGFDDATVIRRRFRFNDDKTKYTIVFDNNEQIQISNVTWIKYDIPFLNNYKDKIKYSNSIDFDCAFFAYSGYRKIDAQPLESIKELTDNPLEGALSFSGSSNPKLLINWIANQKTKEALALARKDTKAAVAYTLSIYKIEQAIERITDLKIEFQLVENPLNVVIKTPSGLLEFDLLPDGLKSIISWISDLLMRLDRIKWKNNTEILDRNFILFLDEIDVHLHPSWQRKILPVVQDLFKNAQIFISTHSPFVVGSTDGMWVHKLVNNGTNSIAEEAILSENSKSYQLILDEFFNIKNLFGIEIEEKLQQFRELRNKMMRLDPPPSPKDRLEFEALIDFFVKEKSIELDSIIGSELKQLSRITGKNYINR